jgi:hypothetical protein
MPKYSYKCNKCDKIIKKILDYKKSDIIFQCDCGGEMHRDLTLASVPTILDTVDKWRNVRQRKDLEKRLRKRAKEHFLRTKLNDAIEEFGTEGSKKVGYIKKSGKKITKDDIK